VIYKDKILLILNLYQLFEKADPKNYGYEKNSIAKEKSLLLVEDTPFFQKIITMYLDRAGYKVFLAQNGKEALDILQDKNFDAVISDIQMPIMDGYELIRQIRASENLKHLPVIALTSMLGDYNKKIGIENGFDCYEFKLDRDKLLETIAKVLDKLKT
jgi:two-component system chemotaxis sensor kinase CheA